MNKKVVLITGSSRGIGANLVENFAKNNFNVVINYSKSENEAQALYQKVLPICGFDSILSIKADVSDRDQVNRMFDQIYSKFNACDILVNNAGINKDKRFLEMTLGE